MARIFISYSSEDRANVRELAYFLEASGHAVWWDVALRGGDDYQLQINKNINTADAVIVVWSPEAVISRWVRAEAGAAQHAGKLVPVKFPSVEYADIPPPFNLTHTIDLYARDELIGAIAAQAERSASSPPMWKRARYEALAWFGVLGTAFTVSSNLVGMFYLADWARALLLYWHEWSVAVWQFAARSFGLQIAPLTAISLTFAAFVTAFAVGARNLESGRRPSPREILRRIGASLVLCAVLFVSVFVSKPLLNSVGQAYVVAVGFGFAPLAFSVYLNSIARLDTVRSLAYGIIIYFSVLFILLTFISRAEEIHPFDKTAVFSSLVPIWGYSIFLPCIIANPGQIVRRYLMLFAAILVLVALSELSMLKLPEKLNIRP